MAHPLEETVVHPLFTVEEDSDDDEIKTVTTIHVARKENGKLVFAPRPRAANDLTSLEQIHAEFGGGEYVLIGYNNGRISARRSINLPGKSKPMYDEGIDTAPAPAAQPTTPPVDPMTAAMGGQMPFFMMMFQQMNSAADRQLQLVISMMNAGKESSSEDKATARAEMQATIERERIAADKQMAMLREMMQLAQTNRSSGSSEDFTRGVEFMRGFANSQIEVMKEAAKGEGNDGLTSILETIGQALQAAQSVGLFKGGPLPNGSPEVVQKVAEVVQ